MLASPIVPPPSSLMVSWISAWIAEVRNKPKKYQTVNHFDFFPRPIKSLWYQQKNLFTQTAQNLFQSSTRGSACCVCVQNPEKRTMEVNQNTVSSIGPGWGTVTSFITEQRHNEQNKSPEKSNMKHSVKEALYMCLAGNPLSTTDFPISGAVPICQENNHLFLNKGEVRASLWIRTVTMLQIYVHAFTGESS